MTTKARAKMTFDEYLQHISAVMNTLDAEINKTESETKAQNKNLRGARKMLTKVYNNSYRIVGQKKPRGKGCGGFSKDYEISQQLADFLQVSVDTHVSRIDATRAICVYSHLKPDEDRPDMVKWAHLNTVNRNLQDPTNKRAIIPDDALIKLLHYDEFINDVKSGKIFRREVNRATGTSVEVPVTDPTLYYWIIQKLVQVHFIKN